MKRSRFTEEQIIGILKEQGAGSIANVSSGATLATYPGSAAYTSSKSGLNMLSGLARLELADAGIVVWLMHPLRHCYRILWSGQIGRRHCTGTRG